MHRLSPLLFFLGIPASLAASARDGASPPGAHAGAPLDARGAAPVAAAAFAHAPELVVGWQPSIAGRRQLTAVAYDPATGRAALGDERGVVLAAPGGRGVESLARPNVTALSFLRDGTLLVGTAQGLYVREETGDLEDRSPAPGEEARTITRLASCADPSGRAAVPTVSAAATAAGVYLSRDGRRWQPVPGTLALAPATAVAIRCRPEGAAIRAVAAGDVWRASFDSEAGQIVDVEPVDGLDASLRAQAVDVLLEADGTEVVLAPDRLALRSPGGSGWQIVRPVLAPGASGLRLVSAVGRRWLATDRGLFVAEGDRSWTRLPPGGALAAVRDVAGDAERILAATDDGLLEGHLSNPAAVAPTAGAHRAAIRALEPAGPQEPAVEEVFRAALAYLSLRPEEMRNLKRGLAARGLLPQLELRLQRGRSQDANADYDESFVSGDVRRLHDRHAATGHDVTTSLYAVWELGDLAFSKDAVDLSKEARAVIQLRDDVLDEIVHLFFERRRVLVELAALDPAEAELETERLRLRADELAAGLDAWTGGWFGQRVPALSR